MNESLSKLYSLLEQRCLLSGSFRLRSGIVASQYFDKYRFQSDPALLETICNELKSLVPADIDAFAGLELGGIPLAVVLGRLCQKPVFFVRKKRKDYGTNNLVEGGDISGFSLCVVEDVISTGGQVIESVAELRREGAVVKYVVAVLFRSNDVKARLSEYGLEAKGLFTKELS